MITPNEMGMKFLILTRGWWGLGDTISVLKRKASREATWPKGTPSGARTYYLYLVHEDTTVDDEGRLVHPSEAAAKVAMFLGTV